VSNVLEHSDYYLTSAIHKECEKHIPKIDEIKPNDAKDAYLYLKAHVDVNVF
jgi:hypothetical protein